jgi:glyoxylase-like metal-dependent hydrolase (beta-lactamase superfamily II)
MEGIAAEGDAVVVTGEERTLTYRPRLVTLSDDTTIEHESRGGTLSSVWAGDLGGRYVEVVHLGHGPEGGELALVVPDADVVAVGDLAGAEPSGATAEWAAALDLAIGLTKPSSQILTSSGPISRDELEEFHQRLLGVLHG